MNIGILNGARRRIEMINDLIDSIHDDIDDHSLTVVTYNKEFQSLNPSIDTKVVQYNDKWRIEKKMLSTYDLCLNSNNDDILVFEDDAIPTDGWYDRFKNITSQLNGDYVLSLYNNSFKVSNELYYISSPLIHFGAVALYFTKNVLNEFKKFIKRYLNSPMAPAQDVALTMFLVENKQYPLYICNPSLVNHQTLPQNSTRY